MVAGSEREERAWLRLTMKVSGEESTTREAAGRNGVGKISCGIIMLFLFQVREGSHTPTYFEKGGTYGSEAFFDEIMFSAAKGSFEYRLVCCTQCV